MAFARFTAACKPYQAAITRTCSAEMVVGARAGPPVYMSVVKPGERGGNEYAISLTVINRPCRPWWHLCLARRSLHRNWQSFHERPGQFPRATRSSSSAFSRCKMGLPRRVDHHKRVRSTPHDYLRSSAAPIFNNADRCRQAFIPSCRGRSKPMPNWLSSSSSSGNPRAFIQMAIQIPAQTQTASAFAPRDHLR